MNRISTDTNVTVMAKGNHTYTFHYRDDQKDAVLLIIYKFAGSIDFNLSWRDAKC